MSALPARWLDEPARESDADADEPWPDDARPSRDDLARSTRRVTRHGQLCRRRAARRRLVALVVFFVVLSGAAALFAATDAPDRFAGVWWEPSTGRRIELVAGDDGYTLLYGAARQKYTARLQGSQLVVASPLGGDIVISPRGEDQLVLKEGGQNTILRRLPDDR